MRARCDGQNLSNIASSQLTGSSSSRARCAGCVVFCKSLLRAGALRQGTPTTLPANSAAAKDVCGRRVWSMRLYVVQCGRQAWGSYKVLGDWWGDRAGRFVVRCASTSAWQLNMVSGLCGLSIFCGPRMCTCTTVGVDLVLACCQGNIQFYL